MSIACVLILEDEPVLREMMSELIQEQGANAIALGTADAGMLYLEQHASSIDLIVTDVRMPGLLSGHDLARMVYERWPQLPVLITSGYSGEQFTAIPQNSRFLAKPWGIGQFSQAVAPYLDGCQT